jgi:L-threonylcarbamoyladenylate synthase
MHFGLVLNIGLKKNAHIPDSITAGKDTVAVRVPNHDLTLNYCGH